MRARPGVLPFLALAIVLTWVLARRAHGEAAAWVAAVAISCVPAVLGHGGLATTDVPFTATFLLALLALLRWIEEPTRGRAIAAGVALGLAEATKYSALVLPRDRRAGGPRAAQPRPPPRERAAAAHASAARGARRGAGRVGRVSLRRGGPRHAVAAGVAAGHGQRLLPVGPRAARRGMAARPPATGARRLPGGAGPVRAGGPGTIDRVPARPADAGRVPGVLPDRDRGQAPPASGRARRSAASSRSCADARRPSCASAHSRPPSRSPPPWRW